MKGSVIGVGLTERWEAAVRAASQDRRAVQLREHVMGLAQALDQLRPDVVLVDPSAVVDENAARELARTLDDTATVFALCTDLSPGDAAATLAAEALNPFRVLLPELGDEVAQVRAVVRDAEAACAATFAASALCLALDHAPLRLSAVVQRLLLHPEEFFDARDLAQAVGVSRRHLDRQLKGMGIVSARRLILAVRVLHAVHRMRRRRQSLTFAASRLGYATRVGLTRHVAALFAVPPSQVRTAPMHDIRRMAREFVATPAVVQQNAVLPAHLPLAPAPGARADYMMARKS